MAPVCLAQFEASVEKQRISSELVVGGVQRLQSTALRPCVCARCGRDVPGGAPCCGKTQNTVDLVPGSGLSDLKPRGGRGLLRRGVGIPGRRKRTRPEGLVSEKMHLVCSWSFRCGESGWRSLHRARECFQAPHTRLRSVLLAPFTEEVTETWSSRVT